MATNLENSSRPMSEKFAGVVYPGETLPRVSFLFAHQLYECGFPQEGFPMVIGKDDQMFAQPYFAEVIQWLKREHGIIINTYNRKDREPKEDYFEYICRDEEWVRTIYVPQDGRYVRFKHPVYTFLTEEDAQAIAIREGILYLRKQLRSSNQFSIAA